MENKKTKYLIGLDLGTSSVGFAVTDLEYNLIRRHGKLLWGSRLFKQAESAATRRVIKRSRRTLGKRTWRLTLLKQELKRFVEKENANFFNQLKNSKLVKTEGEKVLFNDPNYDDVDYFREFPTVFHLRESLKDPKLCQKYKDEGRYYRLLFLATNDILKTRGHFLLGSEFNESDQLLSVKLIREQIEEFLLLTEGDEIFFDNDKILSNYDVYMDKNIKNLKGRDKNISLFKLLIGGEADVYQIFDIESDDKIKISFDDDSWETKQPNNELINAYLAQLFQIYSNIKIYRLIGDSGSYSAAKVNIYENHKRQLRQLKDEIRKVDKALNSHYYHQFFEKSDFNDKNASEEEKELNKLGSYTSYIGKTISEGKKIRVDKNVSREQLIKGLKKIKEAYIAETGDLTLLTDIEDENYLLIPTSKDNRLIPFQLHLKELKAILKEFAEIAKLDNFDNAEIVEVTKNIETLLRFKVPYFVGPLSNKNNSSVNPNFWVKTVGNARITPFNFNDVVLKEETNKEFITRMLRKCTYLYNENCMQQETIAYQTYIFYNTINRLTANDVLVNNEQKALLFEMAQSGKKLTKAAIIKALNLPSDTELSGFSKTSDKEIEVSLSALSKLKKILPEKWNNQLYQEFYDEVLNNISLIDKEEIGIRKSIVIRLAEAFNIKELTDSQIEQLAQQRSKKWGNLSKKFLLQLPFINPETGEETSMLNILKNSTLNMMQILYDENGYNFGLIDDENSEDNVDLSDSDKLHEYLKKRYISPQARRTIIQACKVVDEIVSVMGCEPERISIEFTRENLPNRTETDPRYKSLLKIYQKIKDDKKTLNELKLLEKDQGKLRSKAIYLYFLQDGKDIYTGEQINFDDLLLKNNKYDIDHIYPRSKIKDDSLDNLALTSKEMNGKKGNNVVSEEIQKQHYQWWQQLVKRGLMTSKKYERLTRNYELTEEELNAFVNRQKTTLDWVNLEIAELFAKKFNKEKNDFIVFSKSRHISDFRNEHDLIKFRELNNFHHAHDAYLNIAVGNTIKNHNFALTKDNKRTNNIVTIASIKLKNKIQYMNKIFTFNDVLVTKKTEVKNTGQFWDQNMVKKRKGLIKIKDDLNTELYGGYNKASTAFFSIVKLKGGTLKIIDINTYECGKFYDNNQINFDKFHKYLKERGYEEVVYPILPINTKVIINGANLRIAGKASEAILYHTNTEFIVDKKTQKYLKFIFNFHTKLKTKKKFKDIVESDYYSDGKITITNIANEMAFLVIYNKLKMLRFKYSDHVYTKVVDKDEKNFVKFKTMDLKDQIETLSTIVNKLLFAAGSNQGILFSKSYIDSRFKTTIDGEFIIVKESVTGIFNKKVVIHGVSNSID